MTRRRKRPPTSLALPAEICPVENVRQYLEFVSSHVNSLGPRFEGLVLEHGREFTPGALPAGVERGNLGECFMNAGKIVLDDPETYAYAEGWAGLHIPVHHAWVVERRTGLALEVTWEQPGTYIGIVFDYRWLLRYLCTSRVWGVFYNGLKSSAALLEPGAPLTWIDPLSRPERNISC